MVLGIFHSIRKDSLSCNLITSFLIVLLPWPLLSCSKLLKGRSTKILLFKHLMPLKKDKIIQKGSGVKVPVEER